MSPRKTVAAPRKEEIVDELNMSLAAKGKQKKFRRKAGESDVYYANPEAKAEATKIQVPPELIALKNAEKTGAPFETRINIIREDPDYGLCAICEYGNDFFRTDIIVPWGKFTEIPDEEIEKILPVKYFIQKLQNAQIDVVIEKLGRRSDGTNYAIGNRKIAMQKKRMMYWFADEVGRNGEKLGYRFKEGSVIEARIIGVYAKAGVRVDILGYETVIPARESTWALTYDLEQDFAVGDTVPVKIINVERDETKGDVKVVASIKQVTKNPVIEYAKKIKEKDLVTGTIKYIGGLDNFEKKDSGYVMVEVKKGVQIYCKFPYRFRLGSTVQVNMAQPQYREGEEVPYLYGYITHVIKY